ncbi:phage head-tail connector protein [Kaistia sp. UC242_56]|uniref:head-tail connector protein n=1 Tax=Kaistia sp. UC242_56 TaxID=3374625 RepID=UPI0037AC1699
MWHEAKVIAAPAEEPVTVSEARAQCGVIGEDRDSELVRAIQSARVFIEHYCGIRLVSQTIEVACDLFGDLGSLPEAPLQAVVSIAYVDSAGIDQILPSDVFEPRLDGLSPTIVRRFGKSWPAIQAGSRIKMTATAGYGLASAVPAPIASAILLHLGMAISLSGKDALVRTEAVEGIGSQQFGGVVEVTGAVDRAVAALLVNFRRWT